MMYLKQNDLTDDQFVDNLMALATGKTSAQAKLMDKIRLENAENKLMRLEKGVSKAVLKR